MVYKAQTVIAVLSMLDVTPHSYLHFRVHAVIDHSSPGVGWTSSNSIFTTRGQKGSLVFIEGFQGRVVAWRL